MILALNTEQMTDLERLSGITDEKLAVLGDGSLMYAEDTHLADKGINRDLKNVREHMLGRIGLDGNAFIAFTTHELRRISFGWIRHQARDDIEQFRDPRAALARCEAHGHQVPLAHGLLEGVMQLLRLELLTLLEIKLHQLLVLGQVDLIKMIFTQLLQVAKVIIANRMAF